MRRCLVAVWVSILGVLSAYAIVIWVNGHESSALERLEHHTKASPRVHTIETKVAHQQQTLVQQQDQIESMAKQVVEIRASLIEKRFQKLDAKARRAGWAAHPVAHPAYKEWVFLREHRADIEAGHEPPAAGATFIQEGLGSPPAALPPVTRQVNPPTKMRPVGHRPEAAMPQDYRPEWLLR